MASLINGLVTVTTSGTSVQFTTADTPIKSITVHAPSTNTNNMFVGNSTVTTTNTPPITPGSDLTITFSTHAEQTAGDLKDLWLDAAVNGETVTYLAVLL